MHPEHDIAALPHILSTAVSAVFIQLVRGELKFQAADFRSLGNIPRYPGIRMDQDCRSYPGDIPPPPPALKSDCVKIAERCTQPTTQKIQDG